MGEPKRGFICGKAPLRVLWSNNPRLDAARILLLYNVKVTAARVPQDPSPPRLYSGIMRATDRGKRDLIRAFFFPERFFLALVAPSFSFTARDAADRASTKPGTPPATITPPPTERLGGSRILPVRSQRLAGASRTPCPGRTETSCRRLA